MVHVKFDPSSIPYNNFQVGYGVGDLSYYKGLSTYQRGYGYQRGAGLGNILKGIWRFLLPVLKSPAVKELGNTLGKEAVNSGSRILTKVLDGESLKSAALEEGKSAAEIMLEKGLDKIRQRQTGTGLPIKRRKKRVGLISSQKTIIPPKSIRKRKRSDAFGFY